MLHTPTNNWPDTATAKHYSLFAQTVRLLLSSNAFESFRAPVLDNLMRCTEFTNLSNQIRHRERPFSLIVPARDELVTELKADKIARAIIGTHFETQLARLEKSNPSDYAEINRIHHSVSLIKRQLKPYYKHKLEEEIIGALKIPKERIKLIELTRKYVTLLLNYGYDRRYINYINDSVFFAKPISKSGEWMAKRFFGFFDGQKKEFMTYLPIKKADGQAYRNFDLFNFQLLKFDALPRGLQQLIEQSPQFSAVDLYFKHTVSSYDPHSATVMTRQMVQLYASFSVLEPKGKTINTRSYSFTQIKGKRRYVVVHDDNLRLQPSASSYSKHKAKSLSRNVDSVINYFDPPSRTRIITALQSVALAREAIAPENRLSLIWSATEALFGDPPRGTARSNYYQDCLLVGVLLNYTWRYSDAIFTQVVVHARRALSSTLASTDISTDFSEHQRFQHLLLNPRFSANRLFLMKQLANNPLLTQLVFQFHRNFSEPKRLKKTVESHKDRVHWQIARIYRARNDFVHSGRAAPFVDRLSINAYEYFRTSLQATLYHANALFKDNQSDTKLSVEAVRESLRVYGEHRAHQVEIANLNSSVGLSNFLEIFRRN